MNKNQACEISRRHFLGSALLAGAVICFMPRRLFGGDGSPVTIIRDAAATAKINVTKLRGNVSMLEGSGGNIAALTGRDGKLLVDSGITASRARITQALASLSNDPVNHLINSHWRFHHTAGHNSLNST